MLLLARPPFVTGRHEVRPVEQKPYFVRRNAPLIVRQRGAVLRSKIVTLDKTYYNLVAFVKGKPIAETFILPPHLLGRWGSATVARGAQDSSAPLKKIADFLLDYRNKLLSLMGAIFYAVL